MLTSRRMANRYRNFSVICIGLFLVWQAVGFAYAFQTGFHHEWLFVVLLLPTPLAAIDAYFWQRYRTWSSGAEGEEKVAEALSSLKDCNVYHDIVLPGERTNIDHVVLAPSGVFVVETKNHKGAVRCVGDSWELEKVGRRGTPYTGRIGNPSKQVKRNALMLRKLIFDRLGLGLYVNGVVCFTNPECVLDVSEPTVDVVSLEELPTCILTFKDSRPISVGEIARIRPELEKYASVLE